MTIIAGFPVTGFVVLGADAEEGGSYAKSSVRKIALIEGGDYKCLVGGSGDGDFIDLAVQETRSILKASAVPITLEILRLALESVVTDIYNERIDTLPPAEQRLSAFDLLCAIWTKESQQVQLVKVSRVVSLIRDLPEVIGKGSPLARYLIETLQMDAMECRHAERLCAYILAKVKAHVKDCGGESQIVVLGKDGSVRNVPSFVIAEDETAANMVMDGGVRGLFHWTDYIGWQGDLDKIDNVIQTMTDRMKKEFRLHYAKRQAADAVVQAEREAQKSPTRDH